MPRFSVSVCRTVATTVDEYATIAVEAQSEGEARDRAVRLLESGDPAIRWRSPRTTGHEVLRSWVDAARQSEVERPLFE